jgi:putative ABC transport system permease protein
MKASMYLNYPSRSLFRGGQRTLLAVFCVAVGVMSIVALQLVGSMLRTSLTSNTRDTNGGDIAISAQNAPFSESDLSFFAQRKSNGTITNYTALISTSGSLDPASVSGGNSPIGGGGGGGPMGGATASSQSFRVSAVDPNNYPIVTPPTFVTPSNGTLSALLTKNQVVVTQDFLDISHKNVGDSITIYVRAQTSGSGQQFSVKIAGVIANTGTFAQSSNLVLISAHDYLAANPGTTVSYDSVTVTTIDQAHTDAAVKAITKQFPLVSTQTAADALKDQQDSIDNINKFLEVAGLLALLIGGIGIVNTMQVLLSRRKTEIAMLKTTGYRRSDLYALFGLEAGLLGLIGGVVGAGAAIGVSAIVRLLMQNLGFTVPFLIDLPTVAGGVAIGVATALIFALLPIAQAANIRPLNVIRDLPENRGASSLALTIFLLALLSVLFCGLAIVILNNDVVLGVVAVYGTFAFLLVLSAFFSLVVWLVSKLPVPEHLHLKHLALVLFGVAVSVLLYLVLPIFGLLFLVASVLGIVIMLVPRTWKVSAKLALRNIGRQRTRTTTTMLALFIGVFTIGLVVSLGQNLQTQISNALTQTLSYNIIAMTSGDETSTLRTNLGTLPGLSKSQADTFAQVQPGEINGETVQSALPTGNSRRQVISLLSSVEGYDLTQGGPSLTIVQGRNLTASDAGTTNVVVSNELTRAGSLQMHLKPGDTITLLSTDGKIRQTLTIVGTYNSRSLGTHTGNVLGSAEIVKTLSSTATGVTTITYMKIETAQVNSALNKLGQITPNATIQNLASLGAFIEQLLNSIIEVLVAIASLSLIAGVVIIANAVALAMLERRRELGILKSVGYTSGTVLSEVVIENGIVGAVSALIAMLLATGAITLLGAIAFKLTFAVSPLVVLGLVGGSMVLAMLTATLVAWNAVRVRPLAVLRYE